MLANDSANSVKYSIAIPVHNRADYLRQAITSCLEQTVSDFELVISDDCSTENLCEVAQSFRDSRISYHRAPTRLGAARNHQTAVCLSKGRYVINLHSDDLLLPNCLEVAGRELDARSEAAAVYFICTYLHEGAVSGSSRVPAMPFADATALARYPWLHRFPNPAPSCCLFRRTAFDQIGGYNPGLRFAYDWDLYLRFLTRAGGVAFLPRVLTIYRQHSEQAVQTTSINGLWDMLDLWPQRDDEYWSSRNLAGLVLTQCGIKMRSTDGFRGIVDMFHELARRRILLRLLTGLPAALSDKLRSRLGISRQDFGGEYDAPTMFEEAQDQASKIVRDLR